MTIDPSLVPESARNVSFVGHTDQGGRGDGIQVMVHKGHAYVGHMYSEGVTVIDVRDPRNPKPVNYLPCHPGSWSPHVQTAENILIRVEEFNFLSIKNSNNKDLYSWKEDEYYSRPMQGVVSAKFGERNKDYTAGMRVYDISDPASPREIGFMQVEGLGLHRLYWTGGRYAYASALLDGFSDHILIIIDMKNPSRPEEVGRWWLPGMWTAGGERNPGKGRVACHHAVVADDVAYGCWRDGGLTILDVKDKSNPKLVSHRNLFPPFGGGTHNTLPMHDRGLLIVADEAFHDAGTEPMKHTWVFDIRAPENPVTIATMPIPSDRDYIAKGGHFGPHNLWENRPEAYASSRYVFATYQNAGVRVFDIENPFRPEECASYVPPQPTRWVDPRISKRVLHSCDVFVDANHLMYLTDYNSGLHILQWEGG